MIIFFWSGGLGGGGNRNLGAVLAFVAMFLIPSLVELFTQRANPFDETAHASRAQAETDTSPQPNQTHSSFYLLLLLQVILPMVVIGVLIAALTDDRVRRRLRLGPLGEQDGGGQYQTRTNRASAAAVAAKIRKLPLIEYRSRRDLESMPLSELVAYRNEARDKGYKAITTSSGKRHAAILQSREEVIQDILGCTSEDWNKGDSHAEEDDICSICFAQYESNDILRILPKCGHVFHAECGDLWFVRNQTCPLCKADI